MARGKKRPTNAEVIHRLAAVKLMVQGMADAMPTMARDLRRQARESLDDLIGDLA
jgi:hypothetical protein